MKQGIILIILFFAAGSLVAQSKKEVKKHNIKSSSVVDIEDGKTLQGKKTVFDKNGEALEELDYDKSGALKTTRRYRYNGDGDVLEETEIDAKTNKTEKRIYKYNAL